MYPSPYGHPYNPYGAPRVLPQPPSTAFALTGGIIGIVVACVYLMIAAFVALIGGFFSAIFPGSGDTVMIWAGLACLVSCVAIVCGAFACAARPIWTAVNGGVHLVFAIAWLYPVLDTGKFGALVFTVSSLAATVFSLLGLPQAKAAAEWKLRNPPPPGY